MPEREYFWQAAEFYGPIRDATVTAPDAAPARCTGQAGGRVVSAKFTTPRVLADILTTRLRYAGYPDAAVLRGIRYVTESGCACLEARICQYTPTAMPLALLEGYERALSALPGVVRTQVIHDEGATGKANPLRDQVVVIHRRTWDESDCKPQEG